MPADDDVVLDLVLDDRQLATLEREAERKGVTLDALVEHEIMVRLELCRLRRQAG